MEPLKRRPGDERDEWPWPQPRVPAEAEPIVAVAASASHRALRVRGRQQPVHARPCRSSRRRPTTTGALSNGTASITWTPQSEGTHTLIASYGGNTTNCPSYNPTCGFTPAQSNKSSVSIGPASTPTAAAGGFLAPATRGFLARLLGPISGPARGRAIRDARAPTFGLTTLEKTPALVRSPTCAVKPAGARMNPVLLHLLILSGVLAGALGMLWLLNRLGVSLAGLPSAGVFGFIGAAFGVVVGMTTFFASQHYASVRTAAQDEASQVATVVAMSGSFPVRTGSSVRRQLYCYVTDVINDEWPAMRAGDERGSPKVDGRLRALYRELLRVGRPEAPEPRNWYSTAVSAAIDASQDRQQRLLLGARAQIPDAMWALIYFGAALMVVFTFFFHVEGRRQLVWMTVAVIAMLTALTGVLAGLDHPALRPLGVGPDAMRTEQARLGEALRLTDPRAFCRRVPIPSTT